MSFVMIIAVLTSVASPLQHDAFSIQECDAAECVEAFVTMVEGVSQWGQD
jgi:hypothetical protein